MIRNSEFHSTQFTDERPFRMANSLAKAGYDVKVICTQLWPGHTDDPVSGISTRRLPIGAGSGLTMIFAGPILSFLESLRSPGIVHVHNPPDTLVLSGLGRPTILDLNDHWSLSLSSKGIGGPFLGAMRVVEAALHRMSTMIISTSFTLRDLFVSSGIDESRIKVVLTCPELNWARARESGIRSQEGHQTILFEGNFLWDRGLEVLLKAFRKVLKTRSAARLVLVGNGPEKTTLVQLADALSLAGKVEFIDWQPLQRLPALIQTADVCVVPTLSTPKTEVSAHNKLFDYMACGKAIVATSLGEIRRIVNHMQDAILVSPGSIDELAMALTRLLGDESLRRSLARNAERAARKYYNWERQAQTLLEVYREI
jgi:glycosyltransferase involved in cell wall biosynthesis